MVSDIFDRILALIARREVVISDHGYEELAADGILVMDIYEGVEDAIVVEEYLTTASQLRPSLPAHPCYGMSVRGAFGSHLSAA